MKPTFDVSRPYEIVERDIALLVKLYKQRIKEFPYPEDAQQEIEILEYYISRLDSALELIDCLHVWAHTITLLYNRALGLPKERWHSAVDFETFTTLVKDDFEGAFSAFYRTMKHLRFKHPEFSFTCKNRMWNVYQALGKQEEWDLQRMFRYLESKGITFKNKIKLIEKS